MHMTGAKSLIPVLILAVVGLVYLALPHSLHVSWGIDFGLDHAIHMVFGVVLLAVAGLLYWKGQKRK